MPKTTTVESDTARSSASRGMRMLRSVSSGLLVVLGSVALVVFLVVFWLERTVLTPNTWVSTVAPLPKQPVVSTALSGYITNQIFSNGEVEQKITDALPPKAAFLASPLTDQLNNLTKRLSKQAIESDKFQTVWTLANKVAITRLVDTARGQTPPPQTKIGQKFNIDISDVRTQIASRLGKSATALPAVSAPTKKPLAISANLQSRPERIRQYIRTIDWLYAVLPFLLIACLSVLLAISRQRRRAFLTVVSLLVPLLLLVLIAVKAAREQVLSFVHVSANRPAIAYIYDALLRSLNTIIYRWIALALLILLIGWLLGPSRRARQLRGYAHIGKFSNSKLWRWGHNTRLQARHYRRYLFGGAVVIVLVYLAFFATISSVVALNAALTICILLALVHIVTSPPSRRQSVA